MWLVLGLFLLCGGRGLGIEWKITCVGPCLCGDREARLGEHCLRPVLYNLPKLVVPVAIKNEEDLR